MRYHIGFSTKPDNILSKGIRWITRSQASHTFIFLTNKVILEATFFGIKAYSWEKFKEKNKIIGIFQIKRDEWLLEEGLYKAINRLGEPYDITNLLGQVLVKIVDILFHKKIKNFLGNKKFLQCSEYSYYYLKDCHIPIEIEDIEAINPEYLLDFCLKNPRFFKKVK